MELIVTLAFSTRRSTRKYTAANTAVSRKPEKNWRLLFGVGNNPSTLKLSPDNLRMPQELNNNRRSPRIFKDY
ncbi:hypothetical protein [Salinimicrobium sp. HB62]|uniref:hypothetical protein n=1 Tax=Salinimicrobium sp. HB62 TaxID=3077781 RepID=UPI002D781D12|nr:hypothetical protein [Salinimicrobium sp. HB62]